ncbi:MAG: MATE family efflux transporter [Firmicutes bacterium]|nr:MATE family efflux transporter [Bacillota bacterium]
MRMFPGCFSATITVCVALMVDTILAGIMIGPEAIAAVAIGGPAMNIFQALVLTIGNGAIVKMSAAAGRGNKEEVNQAFSLAIIGTVVLGGIFIAICLSFADSLTMVFGGAGNPEVAKQASLYLKASTVCILMGSLNTFFSKIMALYGYQKQVFVAAVLAILGNLVFSTLYIYLLPPELAIVGLGMGTWTGGMMALSSSVIVTVIKKIPLKLRMKKLQLKMMWDIIKTGFPTSGNNLADGVVSGIVNNIIVMGFGGDTAALSVYTAVKGLAQFATAPVMGTTMATAPLFGVLYGARDRNGIVRAVREAFKVGLMYAVVWCGVIAILAPKLAGFYGMEGNAYFRQGVYVYLLFIPLCLSVRLMTQLFESTEKHLMGMLYSIVPDSVIYPVMLLGLLPTMKYAGIWISYSANAVPFLIVLYLVRSAKNRELRMSPDRLLCIDQSIRDNVPMLDISIHANNTDVTGISKQVYDFLMDQKASVRTAYMTSLCLEELAADFVEHTEKEQLKNSEQIIMDIKLFSDEDTLKIMIRNAADHYNPLDFEMDENTFSKVGVKLAQKVAKNIDYTYIYKMNVITIELDK